jgi:HSP20 family protein
MMTVVRWNPVRELAAMEIDRLNRMFGEGLTQSGTWVPAVDVYETEQNEFVMKVELPEMKPEDIQVSVENNVLTLRGERRFRPDVPKDGIHRLERSYGRFIRTFTLPPAIDPSQAQASYRDGMLTLTLPPRLEARPRRIPVAGEVVS